MKRIERALVILSASCIIMSLLTIGFLTFKTGTLEARVTLLEKSQDDVLDRIDMSSKKLVDVVQKWEDVGRRQPIVIKRGEQKWNVDLVEALQEGNIP